jgi:hypothetical protein
MKPLTNAQLKRELERRYEGGYILIGAAKDPVTSEKPGYQLWLHCMSSAMSFLLEYACRGYEPLKATAKEAAKGRNPFRRALQKALADIAKDRSKGVT